jgi:ABC-type lipoprotein export system ATPase subunit
MSKATTLPDFEEIEENLEVAFQGKTLYIRVPNIEHIIGTSNSGKSNLIATSDGIAKIKGIQLGINIGKSIPRRERQINKRR